MYHILSVCSPAAGHLGCLQLGAVLNDAAVETHTRFGVDVCGAFLFVLLFGGFFGVFFIWWTYAFSSLG